MASRSWLAACTGSSRLVAEALSQRLNSGKPIFSSRSYASSSSQAIEPVELSYDVVPPPTKSAKDQCLVVCHGFLGSKQNWRSLTKTFAQRLGMPVYALDLRNHGSSPHVSPHSYEAMATDINHFIRKHDLRGVNLLGHSMGGKAVMAYALNSEWNDRLRTLISVDMSPARGKISPEFAAYVEAMMAVEKAKVKTKSEADKILHTVEPMLPTRQFLLTNAKTHADGHLAFRIPLPLLASYIPHIGDFPYDPPESGGARPAHWDGPTLFLKGEHSRYINKHNIPIAKQFFPNMQLETLDAGHWVHAEQPMATVDAVERLVKGVKA